MKKVLFIITAMLLICIAFVGCANTSPENQTNPETNIENSEIPKLPHGQVILKLDNVNIKFTLSENSYYEVLQESETIVMIADDTGYCGTKMELMKNFSSEGMTEISNLTINSDKQWKGFAKDNNNFVFTEKDGVFIVFSGENIDTIKTVISELSF